MKPLICIAVIINLLILYSGSVFSQPNPYLQTPTPTSIYISWHSADTSFTQVRFGLSDSTLQQITSGSVQNISGKFWHTVKLTGLTPGTTYHYRCISGNDSSAIFPFRTLPVPGAPGQHIRFAIIGDSRNYDTIPTYLPVVIQNMKQTFITKYGTGWYDSVNLVMHTGDIVWSGLEIERFENEYFTPIRDVSCSVPFMVSIGNHEHESPIYFSYMKYTDFTDPSLQSTLLNQRFYSFTILNCEFIAINTNSKLIGEPLQHQWIRKILASSDTNPGIAMVFPYGHHPYRSSIWPSGDKDSVKTGYFTVFNEFYKVVQYSYGHAHCFEHGVWNMTQPQTTRQHDMTLMLSGGGGAELSRYNSKSKNYPEIFKAVDDFCYAVVDVDVDNQSYTTEVYTLGKPEHPISNEILDSMHFRMNQSPPLKPISYPVSSHVPLILNSSPITGTDSCMSAEVQVTTTPGDYSNPVVDTTRIVENFFGNSGSPDFTPINLNAGINLYSFTVPEGKLNPSAQHGFRVRYRDMNLKWSEWSGETLFTPSGIDENSNSGGDMILWQNQPNPFINETLIRFELKTSQHLTLTLSDMAGKELQILADRDFSPGRHEIKFSASEKNLPAGVYHLRVKGNDSVQTIVMICTK